MMRYLILVAFLLCLPVRGDAWQVVGGGGGQPCDDGILANGCFDDDLSGWTPYSNSGFSAANGEATVSNNGFTYRYATASLDAEQSIIIGSEYSYEITFVAMSAGASCRFSAGGIYLITKTTTGTYSGTFTATSGALPTVKVNTGNTTDFCTFDNVKIILL